MRYHGLDPTDMNDRQILERMQAGILKGHGREFSAFIFIQAEPDITGTAIQHLAAFKPQSAAMQYDMARLAQLYGKTNDPFIIFFLSATGYQKLRIEPRYLPHDIAFRRGMKHASQTVLKDPPLKDWDIFFQ